MPLEGLPGWTVCLGLGRVLGFQEGPYEPPWGYACALLQGLSAGWLFLDSTMGSGATGQQGSAAGGSSYDSKGSVADD